MFKKKDLLILASLRNDGRTTLTDISKQTDIPIATVYERLKLFNNKLVKGYTALLDFSYFGFNARASIAIKALPQKKDDLKAFLLQHLNINTMYKINNGYDFLVECIFRNVKELEEFLEVLDNMYKVRSRDVFYLIDDLKQEKFLADPMLIELVMPNDYLY